MAPRVETFLWKLIHDRLQFLFGYLYGLNIGPALLPCKFCGFHIEIAEHIIWLCNKSAEAWREIEAFTGTNLRRIDTFTNDTWLLMKFSSNYDENFLKAVIATCAWALWEGRCNLSFDNIKQITTTLLTRR